MSTKNQLVVLFQTIFDNYILADELFAKTLNRIQTCVSVKMNLSRKSLLWVPEIFDDNFEDMSVASFVADFN